MSNSLTPLLSVTVAASESPNPSSAAEPLEGAFKALETYNVGSGRASLLPIDEAVVAAHRDASARQRLEQRFSELLDKPLSSIAREYLCRQLGRIGSALSVPGLAALLDHKQLAEAARLALESIPGPEATEALRHKLSGLSGLQKVGVIHSLGERHDASSVPILARLLEASDGQIASAAAVALGRIGNLEAAQALSNTPNPGDPALGLEVADARLACAEALLGGGRKAEALAIYKSLVDASQSAQVQLAAKRGLLLAMQQK